MSAAGNASNLTQAARELLHHWEQTKSSWSDAKGREFEETYLAQLPAEVDRTSKMMAEIDLLLRKIRSECE